MLKVASSSPGVCATPSMAGVLEVLTASGKEARKLWTVVPEAVDAAPETRYGESVDEMLAMAGKELGIAAQQVRPIVLLPAGFGGSSVAGGDAIVLFCDGALNEGDLAAADDAAGAAARENKREASAARAKKRGGRRVRAEDASVRAEAASALGSGTAQRKENSPFACVFKSSSSAVTLA